MKVVGIRDLKNRLSEYVRHVRSGEGLLITDRGEVVAEMVAPGRRSGGDAVPDALAALARRGILTLGAPHDQAEYPPLSPLLSARRARQLLDDERGGR